MNFNVITGSRRARGDVKKTPERLSNNNRRRTVLRLLVGGTILVALSFQGIAASGKGDNANKKERQADNRAERAQAKANIQSARESRIDNRAAATDARVTNRQERRNTPAPERRPLDKRAEKRADDIRTMQQANVRADNRADKALDNAVRDQRAENRADARADNRRDNRAEQAARDNSADARADARADNRAENRRDNRAEQAARDNQRRWDYRMDNRSRYQTYRKYRNNWNEQRVYLRANLRRFNQIANYNQLQQQQIDSQMRAAYLAYHNNRYNGQYNWDNYSDPRFLDYLQTRKPSLLQTILSALGLGRDDDYLYSSDWDNERSQLAQNMANIHQLAVEGRITSSQEQSLLDQMRPEFMAYHNNDWNGNVTWTQYSDPGFVDYLNRQKPSILTTVRDFLIR